MVAKTEPSCVFPPCERGVHARGLCKSCYQAAAKLVRDGKTTWEKLETSGKCKPADRKPAAKTGLTDWLKE